MKNLLISLILSITSFNVFSEESAKKDIDTYQKEQNFTSGIYLDELIDEKLLSTNIYDFCGDEKVIERTLHVQLDVGESYLINLEMTNKLKSFECQSALDYAAEWNEKALKSFPFIKLRKLTDKEDPMKNIHEMNKLIESFRISINALRLKYLYDFLKKTTNLMD